MPYGLMGFGGDQESEDGGLLNSPGPPDMGGQSMLQPQDSLMDFSTDETFYGGNPYERLGVGQQALDAEYHSQVGQEAEHKIAELDKAAKFRRAVSMLTETFATIAGRPDIAQLAQKQMVMEDKERADQVHSQILAHVGLRAIEREKQQREATTQKALAEMYQGITDRDTKYGDALRRLQPDGSSRAALPEERRAYWAASLNGQPPPPGMYLDETAAKIEETNKVEAGTREEKLATTRKEAGIRERIQTGGHKDRRDYDLANPEPAQPPKPEKPPKPLEMSEYLKDLQLIDETNFTDDDKKAAIEAYAREVLSKRAANPASVSDGVLANLRRKAAALGIK